VTRHEANQRIGKQVIDGEALEQLQIRSHAALEEARSRFDRWRVSTEGLLLEVFDGPDPLHHYRFQGKMTFDWMSRDKGFARDRRRFGMAVSSHCRALEFYLSILHYLAEPVPPSPAPAPPLEVPEVNPVEEDALLLLEVMLQVEDPGPGGFSAEWLAEQTGLSGKRLGATVTWIERQTGSLVPRASGDGSAGFSNLHLDLSASHLYHELKAQREEETAMEQQAPPPLPRLRKDREVVRREIQDLIEEGRRVRDLPTGTPEAYYAADRELENWTRLGVTLLTASLDSPADLSAFLGPKQRETTVSKIYHPERAREFHLRMVDNRIAALEGILQRLQHYQKSGQSEQSAGPSPKAGAVLQKVFIVHGHDDHAKQAVARFIEAFEIPVVILHEMPNRGQTIIEKFEDHAAEVGYAIILLTGDDSGGPVGEKKRQRRARQNVIFEMGFFFAKLGRERVICLLQPGVEKPSDIDGVVYEPLEKSGTWRTRLAQELRDAGLGIDMNKMPRH
jgi:predicted nucleotide-binding protein